ncbi:hypothetical protein [Anabaena sp. 4-3]|uniref:hypothetical protein n=1 Tax=Anabaena sp. 4-3 TaxID=1811979 RepID=UPI00082F9FAF|nr:hypothetical protein [Anabaena sp. 4-3]
MKFKPVLSAALLLSIVTLSSTINTNQAVAQSNQKPYCTAASNKRRISYFRYGTNSIADACFNVFQKILNAGHSVDRAEWGYYKTNGLNIGQISCIQGKRTVRGKGSDFFNEASNMRNSLGWSGCTYKVTN